MQTMNPYSPPQATVADIGEYGDEAFQPVHIFAWRGRIGRLRFLAYSTLMYLIAFVLAAATGAIAAATHASSPDTLVGVVVYPVSFALLMMVSIQRSHDMDQSGWGALMVFIPILSLIFVFKSGSSGANRFGPPPVPNSLGVKIVAWLFPAMAILGIVAAIALPAYSNYVMKAKAAQMK